MLIEDPPTPEQQSDIDDYAALYRATFGYAPLGLHYIKDELAVWLPLSSEH